MKRTSATLAVLFLSLSLPALAQVQKPAVTGGTVVASEPGKAAVVSTVEATAAVMALDKATRTLTLKAGQKTFDVVAASDVRNFDQIRVGDNIVVRYTEALSLELRKTKGQPGVTGDTKVERAPAGARPAGAIGREVQAIADVVAVDPTKSTISLKGPRGNVFELKVHNQDHFKVVKKGDQVDVVYAEALAVAVTPAPAAAAKK